jgi:aryl-alcohol dehydrogenase-like predicted oxidoreductase
MYFGSKTDRSTAFQLLDYYFEQGGNFLDTSNNYAFWLEGMVGDESENLLGEYFKKHNNRHQFVVATKVGARPLKKTNPEQHLEGLSGESIMGAVEGSLKRLNTDYIDLYYGHVDFQEYPLEERLEAFDRLKRDGKVREIGTSNMELSRFRHSKDLASELSIQHYVCLQQRFTYLRPKTSADFWVQKLLTDEWLGFLNEHPEISALAYSPLLSGRYSSGNLPEEYDTNANRTRLKKLQEVSENAGITANQMVLAWMLHHQPAILPIVSASKLSQLKENLNAGKIQLTKNQIDKLNNARIKSEPYE